MALHGLVNTQNVGGGLAGASMCNEVCGCGLLSGDYLSAHAANDRQMALISGKIHRKVVLCSRQLSQLNVLRHICRNRVLVILILVASIQRPAQRDSPERRRIPMSLPTYCPHCGAQPFDTAYFALPPMAKSQAPDALKYMCASCNMDYRDASAEQRALTREQVLERKSRSSSRLHQPSEPGRGGEFLSHPNSHSPHRNAKLVKYETTVSLIGFLEYLLIGGIIIGVVFALYGFSSGGIIGAFGFGDPPFIARVLSAIPGFIMSVTFLYMYVQAIALKATIDTAGMTQQLLHIAQNPKAASRLPPTEST